MWCLIILIIIVCHARPLLDCPAQSVLIGSRFRFWPCMLAMIALLYMPYTGGAASQCTRVRASTHTGGVNTVPKNTAVPGIKCVCVCTEIRACMLGAWRGHASGRTVWCHGHRLQLHGSHLVERHVFDPGGLLYPSCSPRCHRGPAPLGPLRVLGCDAAPAQVEAVAAWPRGGKGGEYVGTCS